MRAPLAPSTSEGQISRSTSEGQIALDQRGADLALERERPRDLARLRARAVGGPPPGLLRDEALPGDALVGRVLVRLLLELLEPRHVRVPRRRGREHPRVRVCVEEPGPLVPQRIAPLHLSEPDEELPRPVQRRSSVVVPVARGAVARRLHRQGREHRLPLPSSRRGVRSPVSERQPRPLSVVRRGHQPGRGAVQLHPPRLPVLLPDHLGVPAPRQVRDDRRVVERRDHAREPGHVRLDEPLPGVHEQVGAESRLLRRHHVDEAVLVRVHEREREVRDRQRHPAARRERVGRAPRRELEVALPEPHGQPLGRPADDVRDPVAVEVLHPRRVRRQVVRQGDRRGRREPERRRRARVREDLNDVVADPHQVGPVVPVHVREPHRRAQHPVPRQHLRVPLRRRPEVRGPVPLARGELRVPARVPDERHHVVLLVPHAEPQLRQRPRRVVDRRRGPARLRHRRPRGRVGQRLRDEPALRLAQQPEVVRPLDVVHPVLVGVEQGALAGPEDVGRQREERRRLRHRLRADGREPIRRSRVRVGRRRRALLPSRRPVHLLNGREQEPGPVPRRLVGQLVPPALHERTRGRVLREHRDRLHPPVEPGGRAGAIVVERVGERLVAEVGPVLVVVTRPAPPRRRREAPAGRVGDPVHPRPAARQRPDLGEVPRVGPLPGDRELRRPAERHHRPVGQPGRQHVGRRVPGHSHPLGEAQRVPVAVRPLHQPSERARELVRRRVGDVPRHPEPRDRERRLPASAPLRHAMFRRVRREHLREQRPPLARRLERRRHRVLPPRQVRRPEHDGRQLAHERRPLRRLQLRRLHLRVLRGLGLRDGRERQRRGDDDGDGEEEAPRDHGDLPSRSGQQRRFER